MAFAIFLAALHGFRLLLLPVLQHVLHTGDAATSLLRRVGIFAIAVTAYWAHVRFVEKRRVAELRPKPLGIVVGGLSGAGLILLAMLVLFASGVYAMTAWRGPQEGLWGIAGVILIAAMLEEIVFRGILFRILETGWGTVPALWLQSLIFALMHIDNVEGRASTPEVVATMVSCVLTGALWTMVFVHTRNLWVATANHAAWNFTIVLSGLPLSGLEEWRSRAPFATEYHGPAWLTGGVFGPEDSLLTMTLVAASLAGLYYCAKAKHRLVRTGAPVADGSALPNPGVHHA
jgi:membrane protease YdiL (CAAX protease family)